MFRSAAGACCVCSTPLGPASGRYRPDLGVLAAELRLGELPKPRFGSVERDWLQRWAVVGG